MQRVVIAILICLCAFITAPDGYGQEAGAVFQSPGVLNNQDRAEIVKSVLEHAIAHPVTTLNISWAEIVSSENMTESMLPEISGYEFRLLEPGTIEDRANRSGYMQYLVFSRMRADDGKINVEVCRVTIGTCFGWYSSSRCFNGVYRKESGSWTGELRPSLSKVITPTPLKLQLFRVKPTKHDKALQLTAIAYFSSNSVLQLDADRAP
jgi:hypothetical protein